MEAQLFATPKKGRLIFDNTIDLECFCIENEDIEMVVTIKPLAKTSEKQRMYAYLFGPLIDVAITAYTNAGYALMDKTKARYKLQAEFCKADMYNSKTGEVESYLLDLSKMSKSRLLKFIQDIIFHLESEFNQSAPDSSRYKMMKIGQDMTSVKHKKI